MMKSGDPCPACDAGSIQVVNTFVTGRNRVRYLGCRTCGFRPTGNKVVVPVKFAPPRFIATGSNGPRSQ